MGDTTGGNGESGHPQQQADGEDAASVLDAQGPAGSERATDPDDPRYRPLVSDDDPDFAPPPARPLMSDTTPPPVVRTPPAPGPVRTSRALWLASFVLTAAGILLAFLSHDSVKVDLTEAIGRVSPTYDEDQVKAVVDLVYWGSLAGLAVIIGLEATLLAFVMNRRGGARWLQLIVLVLHAAAALVAGAFLGTGDLGVFIEVALIGGFVVAFAAWLCSLAPAAHRWFRMKDEAQLPASD